MIQRRRCAALLGAVLLLSGCDDLLVNEYPYAQVAVEAFDLEGDAVAGVHLTLYTGARQHAYGFTDGNGRHQFRFVAAGHYGVFAHAPAGYAFADDLPQFLLIDLELGQVGEVGFVLRRTESSAVLNP